MAHDDKTKFQDLVTMSTLKNRALLAGKMGTSYGGKRDLYSALGYTKDLDYADFVAKYWRQDMAGAIINRPTEGTWRGEVGVTDASNNEDTPFEVAYKELQDRLKLKAKFLRLDKLSSLGKYAIMLLGFDDVQNDLGFEKPVLPGKRKLLYVKSFGESSAQIRTYDKNPMSERYGLPDTYKIAIASPENLGTTRFLIVHHSRCLHIARELLENEVEGIPALQRVFNRLTDIEKLTGGSAEMFWRGARPGVQTKIDKDHSLSPEAREDMQQQMQDWEDDLRRLFAVKGVTLESLDQQIADPGNHLDIQIQMISAETGIPKRILTGSERGELASSQDKESWLTLLQGRREEFAEPTILRPFIDAMIKYQVIPAPAEGVYEIAWDDLFATSDKMKSDVGKTRTEALKQYIESGAERLMPYKIFLTYVLGFSDEDAAMMDDARIEAEADALGEEEAFNEEAAEEDTPFESNNEEEEED